MANMTGAIFRPEEHGGVGRDKPELPAHVCVAWKKSLFYTARDRSKPTSDLSVP